MPNADSVVLFGLRFGRLLQRGILCWGRFLAAGKKDAKRQHLSAGGKQYPCRDFLFAAGCVFQIFCRDCFFILAVGRIVEYKNGVVG